MHEKHANTYDPERITKNYRYSRNTTKVRNIMSHCNYWLSSRSNRLLCGRLQRRHRRSWKWVGSTQHGPCHRNNVTYKRAPWCSKQLSCLSLSEETDEFSDSLGRFKSWVLLECCIVIPNAQKRKLFVSAERKSGNFFWFLELMTVVPRPLKKKWVVD